MEIFKIHPVEWPSLYLFRKNTVQTKILKKPGLTGPTGQEKVFGLNFFKTNIIIYLYLSIFKPQCVSILLCYTDVRAVLYHSIDQL
jgi:hypothetical protein